MIFIALRRLIALVLVILFLPIFIATLVIFRVDATVPEVSFYTDTLAEMDVYNYVYDDAIPFALRDKDFDVAESFSWLNTTNQGVADSVRRVVPPEWIQTNVEEVINQAVPYLVGEADSFDITVRLDDRVEAAAEEAKLIIRNADIHTAVMDELVRPKVVDSSTGLLELPFGMRLTDDELFAGIREIVPPEWVNAQVELILDGVTPYVVGKEESFSITLPVQERAPVAVEVLRGWLLSAVEDGGARAAILEEYVMPQIQGAIGSQVDLPLGVSLTDAEIRAAVEAAVTQQWVEGIINDAADAFGPYIVGQVDTFTLAVPIREPLEAALGSLVTTVDAKYEAIFSVLPTCTPLQLLTLNLTLAGVPECLPDGVTYAQTKDLLGLDIVDQLQGSLIDTLPQTFDVTEAALTEAVGNNTILEDARLILSEGYTFTEQKLRTTISDTSGQGTLDNFDTAREILRDGFTYTALDLREDLTLTDEVIIGPVSGTFDDIRGWIDQGRTLLPLILAIWVLLLGLIGFLGGRKWLSKLGWAGVPLLLAGAIVAGSITVGVTYLRTFFDDFIAGKNIPAAFLPKVIESRDILIDTFMTPMQIQGAIAAGVGLAMVLVGIFLSKDKGQAAPVPPATQTPPTEA